MSWTSSALADKIPVYVCIYVRLGLDVSEENLEDLLTYDDLFLDFFNAFLSLPVREKLVAIQYVALLTLH